MSDKPKSAPVYKVGDKVAIIAVDFAYSAQSTEQRVLGVASVERVGKRLRLSDGSEWHVTKYGGGQWTRYGVTRGGGRIRPVQPGDEESVAARKSEEERERLEDRKRTGLLGQLHSVRWHNVDTATLEKVLALVEPPTPAGSGS